MEGYTTEELMAEYKKACSLFGAYDVWMEDGGRHKGLYCRDCGADNDMSVLGVDSWLFSVPKNPKCSSCDKYFLTYAMGDGYSRYPRIAHECGTKCTSEKHWHH